jgi:trigger factor
VNVEFPHDHPEGEGEDHEDHVDRYRVTVQTVLNRIVPELDEAFILSQTRKENATLEDLKGQIREELQRSWDNRARQSMESKMVEQFVAAHRDIVQVPETIVESALDAQIEEMQQRNGGQLPPTFDADAFRDQNREQAVDQVRWLFVKDKLVTEGGLEVTPEDMDAEFAKMAGDDGDLDMIKGYFTQQPQLLQQMGDQLLNQRVFEALESRFEIIEKSREDIEKEAAERRAAQPVELTPDLEGEE